VGESARVQACYSPLRIDPTCSCLAEGKAPF